MSRKRGRQKRIDYAAEFQKSRKSWNECYKPAIASVLQANPQFESFAMLGLLVCMERAYFLKTYKETGRLSSDSGKMLMMFFEDINPQELKLLKRNFVNALRHDGRIRAWGGFSPPLEQIQSRPWQVLKFNVHGSKFTRFNINPAIIWQRCAPQIDAFYNQYTVDLESLPTGCGEEVDVHIGKEEDIIPLVQRLTQEL